MNKRRNSRNKFERPDDPYWNPDEDPIETPAEEYEMPLVNTVFLQAFVDEWQPEHDERIPDVRAINVGELRDILHIYRTFDCKSSDPLPFYIAQLESHGFHWQMGCSGEQVMLVRRRNNGKNQVLT